MPGTYGGPRGGGLFLMSEVPLESCCTVLWASQKCFVSVPATIALSTLHPYTLRPTPYTLHPATYIPHPLPFIFLD